MAVKQNVQFVDDKERELFATVVLSEDVREFLTTPVGRYLHHRAKAQIQQSEIDALAVPIDGLRGWLYARRKLRIIQQRAQVARLFINWLGDAIVDGNNAEAALREYRE
jgi:hypothetical protein